MTYTLLVRNSILGKSHYVGIYADQGAAEAQATCEAARSRTFISYEVWTGSPKQPGKPTSFVVQGTK